MPTCPHCGFEAERGSVECPLCGTRLNGGVATADTTATTADRTPEGPIPWEDPEVPFFEGLWRTWRQSVFEPASFFRRVSPRGNLARPVLYLLIVSVTVAFISLAWVAVLTSAGETTFDYGMTRGLQPGTMALLEFFFAPFAALLWLALATLFLHLFALLVAERPRSIGGTARALCYVTGPNVFGIVPLLGSLAGAIWTLVLHVIAMRETHRTSTGRAVIIVFALPLLAFILVGMLLGIIVSVAAI